MYDALVFLNTLKENNKINKIKIVTGAIGYGFITWSEKFQKGNHFKNRSINRKAAMNYVEKYCDYCYLTENDNGAEDVVSICNELSSYLKNVKYEIIIDREKAIKKAIADLQENEALLISGRGNRKILCTGEKSIKIISDYDIARKTIGELDG